MEVYTFTLLLIFYLWLGRFKAEITDSERIGWFSLYIIIVLNRFAMETGSDWTPYLEFSKY
jgi:hypothetical protein